MQVANVSTSTRDVRSEIDGWSFEDANLLVRRPDPSNPQEDLHRLHTRAQRHPVLHLRPGDAGRWLGTPGTPSTRGVGG